MEVTLNYRFGINLCLYYTTASIYKQVRSLYFGLISSSNVSVAFMHLLLWVRYQALWKSLITPHNVSVDPLSILLSANEWFASSFPVSVLLTTFLNVLATKRPAEQF